MALRLYRVLWMAGGVMVGSLAAAVVLRGGWQSAAAALALMAGSGVLTAAVALGVMGDGAEPAARLQERRTTVRTFARAEQPRVAVARPMPLSPLRDEPAPEAGSRPDRAAA
jgi:hypothetical protein